MDYSVHQKAVDGIFYNHYTHNSPPLDATFMHIHNDYEILYILSGDVTHIIEDRKYKLKKDDLIIVRPHNYHFIQIDKSIDYERYNILFDPNYIAVNNINLLPENIDVINCKHLPFISDLFKKIDYFNLNLKEDNFKKALSLLLSELIYHLSFINSTYELTENSNPIISLLINEINSNLFTIKSVKEIANKFSLSESYIHRIFNDQLKTTPLKYINEKKLHFARNLLLSGQKSTSVYLECGFSDYSSFYRNYKKIFGHSPSDELKTQQNIYK